MIPEHKPSNNKGNRIPDPPRGVRNDNDQQYALPSPNRKWINLVVGVICLLVLLVLFIPTHRHHGHRRSQCKINLRQIGLAIFMYAEDNYDQFPYAGVAYENNATSFTALSPDTQQPGIGPASLKLLYPVYLDNADLFCCPTSNDKTSFFRDGISAYNLKNAVAATRANKAGSYAYDPRHRSTHHGTVVMAGGRRRAKGSNKFRSHSGAGGNVVFCDAHVEWILSPRTGTLATDADNDIWAPGNPGYMHDSCLVF
jgi:prepilin-type processing-associated H-X9-DG protein